MPARHGRTHRRRVGAFGIPHQGPEEKGEAMSETLNQWGEYAVRFVWPMLWQSSLLIAVLFALNFALRRRVRTAVRYALWLVVLIKLLVPPSLAFPTGL